ncbi:hypothetical protein WN943_017839 [Citrus x changshan-huyou]
MHLYGYANTKVINPSLGQGIQVIRASTSASTHNKIMKNCWLIIVGERRWLAMVTRLWLCGAVEHALSNEKLRGCWCGGDLAMRWLLGRLKAWRDDRSMSAVS